MTNDVDPIPLRNFKKVTVLNSAGEITVNAGRYARGAVAAAFQMIGGIEKFAEWAEDNPTEFYTKMFGKVIGRETETKATDNVEALLKILDGEAVDITDQVAAEMNVKPTPLRTETASILGEASKMYAAAEPVA